MSNFEEYITNQEEVMLAQTNPYYHKLPSEVRREKTEKKLAEKMEKRDKKLAQIEKLNLEIELLQKTPIELKKYKKSLDAHCKIIAGAVALKLFKNSRQDFSRDNFKNMLLPTLKNREEKEYFSKILDAYARSGYE